MNRLADLTALRDKRRMLAYHTPLNATELRRLGILEPWTFGLADRVRFGELDALGHVNHTAYLRWFESFRLPYLNARHVTDYGPTAPRLVLRNVSAEYRAEMFGGTDYIVAGRTRSYRRTSFTMEAAVFALPEATLTCAMEAVIVLLERNGEGRFPIPAEGIKAFTKEDGATPDA
ncbi:MAG: acyl-CoA thioesterase [Pseudomonadota bacterium]